MPMRSEVDPRSLENGLEYCFLVERTQPGAVRLRVAGMHLCDLMGMEVRGMPLRAFLNVASRPVFTSRIERVFHSPEIQIHHLVSNDHGMTPLSGQMMLLPLKGETGEVDRAMGCLVTSGTVGPNPRRFRLLDTDVTCLRTGNVYTEAKDEIRDRGARLGFAEAQQPLSGTPISQSVGTRADGRPDLKIID